MNQIQTLASYLSNPTLKEKSPTIVVLDLETDGLLHNLQKCFLISLKEYKKGSVSVICQTDHTLPVTPTGKEACDNQQLQQYEHRLKECSAELLQMSEETVLANLTGIDILVGHNIVGFDIPVIKKLYNKDMHNSAYPLDTYLLSQMLFPERQSHSLESWAAEFDMLKVKNEDWSELTYNMVERNVSDVLITEALLAKLFSQLRNVVQASCGKLSYTSFFEAYDMELAILREVTEQSIRGCPYDKELLDRRISELKAILDGMQSSVDTILGIDLDVGIAVAAPFKRDGTVKVSVAAHFDGDTDNIYGAFTKVGFQQVRLSQHAKVKDVLLSLGWMPANFTEQGAPRLPKGSEWDTIASESGRHELAQLATYGSLKNRYDILTGWKSKELYNGRIDYGAATCGTPTGRFKHFNVVNIPRATWVNGSPVYYPDKQGSIYGTEMREIIKCPYDDMVQVGVDLSGIELRVLAHMINNTGFNAVVLEGDIHKLLWDNVTDLVKSRSDHKSVLYGMMYGAGDGKLGALATALPPEKRSPEAGRRLRANIEKTIPNFGVVIENVKMASLRGYLRGLDGRPIFCKASGRHTTEKIGAAKVPNPLGVIVKDSLNRYIQSTAAIIFKKWVELALIDLRAANIKFETLIMYHDELQSFVHKDDVDKYVDIVLAAITKAEKYFKFKIKLDGEYKIGSNWSDCH